MAPPPLALATEAKETLATPTSKAALRATVQVSGFSGAVSGISWRNNQPSRVTASAREVRYSWRRDVRDLLERLFRNLWSLLGMVGDIWPWSCFRKWQEQEIKIRHHFC
uniref:Uncharacterized protein n=1 Tax=Leersia perrieri TaxID=77586 RepID=A0A0D9WS11_9ORYZ